MLSPENDNLMLFNLKNITNKLKSYYPSAWNWKPKQVELTSEIQYEETIISLPISIIT